MITTISKEFDFDAAHFLPKLPAEHKCHRMHGHTYRVEVRFRGPVNEATGMIIDWGDVAEAWAPIHAALDHRTLNDVPGLENPTAEVLAAWIAERLAQWTAANCPLDCALHSIRVYESSTTWAEVLW